MLGHQEVAALAGPLAEVDALLAGDELPVGLIKQLKVWVCSLKIPHQRGFAQAVGSTDSDSHGVALLTNPNTTSLENTRLNISAKSRVPS